MITFHDAKDGNKTCSIENIHLHSAYSPLQEAKRFSDSLESPFIPKTVLIIEPCISYCAQFLKEKFKDSIIAAIRFSESFKMFDSEFDKVFYLEDLEKNPDEILNCFGEEKLCACFVASWPPSEKAFYAQCGKTVEILKNQIQKSRDILGTRSYFASRWILNAVSFSKNIRTLQEQGETYEIKSEIEGKIPNIPIIIAASGPSLKNLIPTLKKLQNESGEKNYFLIAVSSAYTTLKKNGIKCDICLTTDGGFYAKKHIAIPGDDDEKTSEKTVWAVASEGAFPKSYFSKKKIIPLSYFEGVEKEILNEFGIKAMKIERNGTVSGTALQFAKSLTTGDIFLLGLDLSPSDGFQHTQPNALDKENDAKQNRTSTKETRLTRSRFSSGGSLSIYSQWFSNLKKEDVKNVYRIKENYDFSNKLGFIQEKNGDFLEESTKKYSDNKEKCGLVLNKISETVYKNTKTPPLNADFTNTVYKNTTQTTVNQEILLSVQKIIQNNLVDIFPFETVLKEREKDAGNREKIEIKLKEKEENLVRKIRAV